MKNEIDVIRDISEKIEELSIPFMLTGSMAMNYYAMPRMTLYIDIVLDLELERDNVSARSSTRSIAGSSSSVGYP